MLLQQLLENLSLDVEPFATCEVARGWRLRLPAQDWVTLHFMLRGEGLLRDAHGLVRPLPAHALALVPPRAPHALQYGTGRLAEGATQSSRDGIVLLHAGPHGADELVVACGRIRATWAGAAGLFDRLTDPIVVEFADAPRVVALFEELLDEQTRPAPGSRQMTVAIMQQCLVALFRRLCASEHCTLPWLQAIEDQRLARALGEVLDRPEDPHTVATLARRAAMSRSAFASRFRAAFGRTPMQFVKEARLRASARLLQRGDLSVDTIAARAGFASRSHFSRAFRALYGRPPSAYRAGA